MKKGHYSWLILIVAALLVPTGARAQQDFTNRFTFSARFGLNISAKFKQPVSTPTNPRNTPDGDPFNYDDGYVLTDVSGNFGGQTWYWGYDNASQIAGDTIQLSRSTPAGNISSPSFDDNPNYGGELVYSRQLGVKGRWRYGFEVAANYLSLSLSDNSTLSGNVNRLTDAYPFTPGTTPPQAPYQGSFNGPGFFIGDTPVSSTTTVVPGNAITDRRQLDSDLWGLRVGPYLELPLGERVNLSISGGLAAGLLSNEASWTETINLGGGVTATSSGNGDDHDFLFGGYVGANVSWQFAERWSAVGGVQYQNLGTYKDSLGGRKVELDFSNSILVTLGVGYSF